LPDVEGGFEPPGRTAPQPEDHESFGAVASGWSVRGVVIRCGDVPLHLEEQARRVHAAGADAGLGRACPALRDVLAREMNHGVERPVRFEPDLSGVSISHWSGVAVAGSAAKWHDAMAAIR
jgi:hypothetical protein